jgi:hypothetical protein
LVRGAAPEPFRAPCLPNADGVELASGRSESSVKQRGHNSMPTSVSDTHGPSDLDAPVRPGAIVWITGLASTHRLELAEALCARLARLGPVRLLDSRFVRDDLPPGACVSSTPVRRVAEAAEQLAQHGVIAVAPVMVSDARAIQSLPERSSENVVLVVFVESDLDAMVDSRPFAHRWGLNAAATWTPDVTLAGDWQTTDQSVEIVIDALAALGVVAGARP